jgi:hypothetical protein
VKTLAKYGWEITDEVQRHVGNTSEIQFVPKSAYDTLIKKVEELEARLKQRVSFDEVCVASSYEEELADTKARERKLVAALKTLRNEVKGTLRALGVEVSWLD